MPLTTRTPNAPSVTPEDYETEPASRASDWLGIGLLLSAGAALRVFFIHHFPRIGGDSWLYGDIAKNWLSHGIYGRTIIEGSTVTIAPTLLRLPGYPAFLALCFALFGREHYGAVLYAQAAIDLVSCLLIAGFVRRLCGRRAAAVALLLAAMCPFTAQYVAAPLTETLSIFCVALGFYSLGELLVHPRPLWIVLLTFSWSYAALLRPDGALLAVVLWAGLIFYGRKTLGWSRALRIASICGLVAMLPFVPWTVRNWRTFAVFEPLAPRSATDPGEFVPVGFGRWTKTWIADFASTYNFYWNADSDELDIAKLPARAFDNQEQYERTRKLLDDYNNTTTLSPQFDARFGALAAERIRLHPFRYYAWLPLLRVLDMWLRPRVEMLNVPLDWWMYARHPRETRLAILYGVLNLGYLLAALVGLVRWPRRALLWSMVGLVVLRSLLLATVQGPETRYTLECFPVVIALAAIGLTGKCVRDPGRGLY